MHASAAKEDRSLAAIAAEENRNEHENLEKEAAARKKRELEVRKKAVEEKRAAEAEKKRVAMVKRVATTLALPESNGFRIIVSTESLQGGSSFILPFVWSSAFTASLFIM